MQQSTREKLIQEIEGFLRRSGMSKTKFGRDSIGNEMILDQLKAGKHPRIDSVDAMRAFIKAKREELRELKQNPKMRRGTLQPAA